MSPRTFWHSRQFRSVAPEVKERHDWMVHLRDAARDGDRRTLRKMVRAAQRAQAVHALLQGGICPKWQDVATVVHMSCLSDSPAARRAVSLLLEAGAPVDVLTERNEALPLSPEISGISCLGAAAHGGSYATTQLLLKAGASPDTVNSFGFLPLHLSVHPRGLGSLRALLEGQVRIDAHSRDGFPAIAWAALLGRFRAMKLLHAHGASLYGRCGGKTLAQLVRASSVSARQKQMALAWLRRAKLAEERRAAADPK